ARPVRLVVPGRVLRAMAGHGGLVHSMAFSRLLPFAVGGLGAPWVHTEHWSGLTAAQLLPGWWQRLLPVLSRLLARPEVVTAVCDYLAAPIREVGGVKETTVGPSIVPVPGPVPPRPAHARRPRPV